MNQTYRINVNGEQQQVSCDPETPLLYVLRNMIGLNGPKFGCGMAQCGACMVLLDNKASFSCTLPISAVGSAKIVSLEGLKAPSNPDELHPVQQAFFEHQAAQCGYCSNGMVMSVVGLLSKNPHPNEQEIRQALQANLCRCGTHSRVISAVKSLNKGEQS